jgi:hypothetical protein
VIGVVLIIVLLVVVLPVLLMMSGAAVAMLIGVVLRSNGEQTHAGSELVDLNR